MQTVHAPCIFFSAAQTILQSMWYVMCLDFFQLISAHIHNGQHQLVLAWCFLLGWMAPNVTALHALSAELQGCMACVANACPQDKQKLFRLLKNLHVDTKDRKASAPRAPPPAAAPGLDLDPGLLDLDAHDGDLLAHVSDWHTA